MWTKCKEIVKMTINLLALILVTGCAVTLRLTDVFPVRRQIVKCNDVSYKNLVPELESAWMSRWKFDSLCILVPIMFIVSIEALLFLARKHVYQHNEWKEVKGNLRLLGARIFKFSSGFLVGLIVVSIIVDTTKALFGIPRPYYLSLMATKCCTKNSSVVCDHVDEDRALFLSFPSYHCAISCYCTSYIISEIHFTIGNILPAHMKTLITFAIGFLPIIVCADLITVHHNHMMDIGVGIVYGVGIAVYQVYIALDKFSLKKNGFNSLRNPETTARPSCSIEQLETEMEALTLRAPPSTPEADEQQIVPLPRFLNRGYSYGVNNLSSFAPVRPAVLVLERALLNREL